MKIKLKDSKRRNIYCAILTRTFTFNSAPKRERTRSAKLRVALKDYN